MTLDITAASKTKIPLRYLGMGTIAVLHLNGARREVDRPFGVLVPLVLLRDR